MRSATCLALGTFLTAWVVAGSPAAWAQGKKPSGGPSYDVVRLAFPGAAQGSTWAYDLNDRGNVVGEYEDNSGTLHGFHFELATSTYLSLGAGTWASGVNQFDEIVGTDEVGKVGLYWSSPAAEPAILPPLPGHTHSRAVALNGGGIIIGSSYIPEYAPVTPGFRAAVAWYVTPLGEVSDPVELPFLAGDIAGLPYALTEPAEGITTVVGTSGWSSDIPLPVSWTVTVVGGSLIVAGPVQLAGTYVLAEAHGINNFGDVVGRAAFADGEAGMPFLKRAGQAVAPLPLLPKAVSGQAADINDAGLIVGGQGVTVKPGGMVMRAVLWTSPTTAADLNSLVSLARGESLTWSMRINGPGEILALINGNSPCLLIPK